MQFRSGIHLIIVQKWENTEDHVVGKYFVWEHSKQKAYPLKDNVHLTHNLDKQSRDPYNERAFIIFLKLLKETCKGKVPNSRTVIFMGRF